MQYTLGAIMHLSTNYTSRGCIFTYNIQKFLDWPITAHPHIRTYSEYYTNRRQKHRFINIHEHIVTCIYSRHTLNSNVDIDVLFSQSCKHCYISDVHFDNDEYVNPWVPPRDDLVDRNMYWIYVYNKQNINSSYKLSVVLTATGVP
jgi:hypothetical protein